MTPPAASPPPFFVAGGTVPPGSPSYVERAADRELYEALLAGEFCFVLNSRQMGKSSLAVRTIGRLQEAGVRTAFVDLTRLGATGADPERWYTGLLMEVGRAVGLRSEAMAYLRANPGLLPSGRFVAFLAEEVLARIDGPLVVFIDEVDATRALPFSADDLFAGIRQAWNARAENQAYGRLAFCLMGAALPSDLIRDPRMTPFNVGRRVELRDFTPEEARPFADGLPPLGEGQGWGSERESALARVLYWTGGHPFLTQALCAALADSPSPRGGGRGERDVDALVRARYLDARARDTDTNLADVANRLLGTGDPGVTDAARADALSLYERMLRGRSVPDDEANPAADRVKMSGVARVEGGHLKLRNRMYREAFDAKWVRENMPGGELRRQKRAFYRGVLRTAGVSAVVLAVVSGLAIAAVTNERKAQTAQREADRQRGLAEAKTLEAQEGRDAATKAKDAVVRTAADLKAALARQSALSKEVAKERDNAKGQTVLAQRSAALARRNAQEALRNAAEASRQRLHAEGQTRLVLQGQKVLEADLYESTIESAALAMERGQRAEAAAAVDSVAGRKDKGWEWGYLRRLSKAVFVLKAPYPGARPISLTSVFVPSEGPDVIVYDIFSARRVDPTSGRTVRELWRLPIAAGGRSPFNARVAFSPNGRWAVHEDVRHHFVVQDLLRGSVRPLDFGDPDFVPSSISNDGERVLAHSLRADPVVWDVRAGRPVSLVPPETPIVRASASRLTPDGGALVSPYRDEAKRRYGIAEYEYETGKTRNLYALSVPEETQKMPFVSSRTASDGSMIVMVGSRIAVFDQGRSEPRLTFDSKMTLPNLFVSRDARFLLTGESLMVIGQTAQPGSVWDLRTGKLVAQVAQSGPFAPDGRILLASSRADVAGIDWRGALPYREVHDIHVRGEGFAGLSAGQAVDQIGGAADGTISVQTAISIEVGHGAFSTSSPLSFAFYDAEERFRARYPAVGELGKDAPVDLTDSFLSVLHDDRIEVRRVPDLRPVRTLTGAHGTWPSLSQDGRRAASIDGQGVLRVWTDGPNPSATVPSGLALDKIGKETDAPTCMISPDRSKVLAFTSKSGYRVWDPTTLRLVASSGESGWHSWSPASTAVLSSSTDGGLIWHDLASGKTRRLQMPTNSGQRAISPDERLIAMDVNDEVEIRSTRTGRRLLKLDTRRARDDNRIVQTVRIANLDFSPDGRRLSVLYEDGGLRIFRRD